LKQSPYLEATRESLERLRRLPAFADFKDEHLELIVTMSRVQRWEPGEAVIREGEFDCWMYFVISGEVRVEKQGAAISYIRSHGEVFGEMGVIDGHERSATVTAVRPTVCLAVDVSFLDRLKGTERTLCYTLLNRLFASILAHRLREATAELARTLEEKERLTAALDGRAGQAGRAG
jgi:CRP-like cAMP-binding protein